MDYQNPNPWMQPPLPPQPPPRQGTPTFVWVLVGIAALVPFSCISYIGYAAAVGPDYEAKPGSQTPKRFIDTMRERGLLGPTETPTYFYSDAMTDITNGMYFFTDQKVVAYSNDWDPPAVVVPLADITKIDFAPSTGWPDDSMITVEHGAGKSLQIPVTPEQGGDRRFYESLEKAWKKALP